MGLEEVNGEEIFTPPMVMGNMQFQLTLVTGLSKGDRGPAGLQKAEKAFLIRLRKRKATNTTFLSPSI